tara:strand:+ start:2374 stop:2772 length:399 start_codon:yes stop_codon:yes gene_type:complete
MTETPTTIDLGDGITAALLPFSDVELTLPCGTNMLVTFVEEGTTHGDLLGLIRENLASDDPMFTNELNVDGKPVQVAGPWWRECEGEHHHRRHKLVVFEDDMCVGGFCRGCINIETEAAQDRIDDRERNMGF